MSFFGLHVVWKKQQPMDYTTTWKGIEESGPKYWPLNNECWPLQPLGLCVCVSHIYTLEGCTQDRGASIFQLGIHCISESINYSPALKYWYGNHHPHKWWPTYRQSVLPFTVSLIWHCCLAFYSHSSNAVHFTRLCLALQSKRII